MKIAILQGSTQTDKNALLYQCTLKATERHGHEVFNFGVFPEEKENYAYTDIALLVALLINSKAVDFVITGCSSGQGIQLACNALPNVLCGYVPTPQDAYLFARINNGNVASLSLGLGFGWLGDLQLQYILDQLFCEPFGIGYPPAQAARKVKESNIVKELHHIAKRPMPEVLQKLDLNLVQKALHKQNVIEHILHHGKDEALCDYLRTLI